MKKELSDDIVRIDREEKRDANFLSVEMRLYILYAMTHRSNPTKNREIKCEICGSYKNLEIHHDKYFPKEQVLIDDVRILCHKCHRNAGKVKDIRCSQVKTVFEKGKRFCITNRFKFEY